MAEYFDAEEVTRAFDKKLTWRFLAYLKPDWPLVVLAGFCLLLATAGELSLPLLIRRVLDEAVLVSYRRFEAAGLASATAQPLPKNLTFVEFGSDRFLLKSQISAFTDAELQFLEAQAILDETEWYVFEFAEDSPAAALVETLDFQRVEDRTGGQIAAVPLTRLAELEPLQRRIIRAADYRQLLTVGAWFGLILILVLFASFGQFWTTNLIGQRVMVAIRSQLYANSLRQSLAFLARHPVGRLVTRLTSDVETINEFFTSVLAAFLKDLSIMVGVIIALVFLSPQLAVATLATLPPVGLAVVISRVKARDAFRRQRRALARVNAFLAERLSGIMVVQLFGKEQAEANEFIARDGQLLKANLSEMYVFATFRPVIDFLASLSVAVIIVVGAALMLKTRISLGVLIAFINLIQMFYSPIQDIAEKYIVLQSAMAGGERVFNLMDSNERIPDQAISRLPQPVSGKLDFDRVCFSYKSTEPVINDLSFSVAAGHSLAIVGYTGAGKTTIANLITRLWDVQSGQIRLDGIPTTDLALDELRRTVLPVLQEVQLFTGTIAENISLGLPLTPEELRLAARTAGADGFINQLPLGYNTVLTEGATNISTGQRQLISFARVIAHNPRLIILDEATSAVDSQTERLIQDGIAKLLAGRSSIIIAHRLSTIRQADAIMVLSGGRLVEYGKHEELLNLDGLYAGLFRLQYQSAEPPRNSAT